jgi:2-dehydro-3-deoxyglucarate aldolase/4-hydroxy-2-oxoheptanedioate aldolase
MVPNVESAEQAKRIVGFVKYGPAGGRGLGLGTAHNDFAPPKPEEFLPEANRNTTVICQIESVLGVRNSGSIAEVPGVDILWVGQFDLTQSMGIVGQFEHERFLDALRSVATAAREHGKAAGIQPGTAQQAADWHSIGYNVISAGSDAQTYRAALIRAASEIRRLENLPLRKIKEE